MKKIALIVAGGSGSRMKSNVPKQFLELNGIPVLMHTLSKFSLLSDKIILVLPVGEIKKWKDLCVSYNFNIPHQVVSGGETRFQSVKNGLTLVDNDSIVAIHDGVRPLVSDRCVIDSYHQALTNSCAIAAVKPKNTLRMQFNLTTKHVNRNDYFEIQTPQTFIAEKIKKAYQQLESNLFTDDASVFEADGNPIHLIEGEYSNIKITTPEDLVIAEAILKHLL